MPRSALLPAVVLALVAGVTLYLLFGGDEGASQRPTPLEADRDPPVRPGLTVSGTARKPLRATRPPLSPEERARRERLATLWERAVALHSMGRSARGYALLEPLLSANKAFFEEPERATLLAAMRKAASKVLAAEDADERLRKLVEELVRWGNLRPSDDADALEQQLRHAAEVIAKLKNKTQRERMLRHLQRFLVPRRSRRADREWSRRAGAKLDVDGLLDMVGATVDVDDGATIPLPIADPEKVEERRMEQLELLRRRGALSLLDSLHAGLAFLALHQGPSGRFSDGDALAKLTLQYAGDDEALDESRRHLSKGNDRCALSTTALALMAFLDFRDQDGRGLFEPTIARAVAWLRKQQSETGLFKHSGRSYYSDAIALMALAQAAGASGDEQLEAAVARGLQALYAVRGPQGGYRYRAKQAGDLSAAGWVAQAVEYATLAGIAVPEGMRAGLTNFLNLVWLGRERFSYLSHGGNRRGRGRPSLYPVGMLMGRILWDLEQLEPADAKAWSTWLTKGVGRRAPYLYTLYYGVRMDVWMHRKLTSKWHDWLVELSRKQFQTGPLAGGFSRTTGRYTRSAGTLFTTAFSLLTMEHALFLR